MKSQTNQTRSLAFFLYFSVEPYEETPAFLVVISIEQESCPMPKLKVLLRIVLQCDRIKEKIVLKNRGESEHEK